MKHGLTYGQWLDEVAVLAGYGSGSSLVRVTGLHCWQDYWEEGYSPQEAWDEDCANAD